MKQSEIEFNSYQPLAARMRPRQINDYIGQSHILAEGKPLRRAIENGHLHSMILWGPPGTGKTSLARLLAENAKANMHSISAVLAGVKDIRQIVEQAKVAKTQGKATVLFVDEVHRFNKAQQDAFLPHVEDGTITLIGATTENPSFELNSALLSRARVYILKRLSEDDLLNVIQQAIANQTAGYGNLPIEFSPENRLKLAKFADGDARRCLNFLELAVDLATTDSNIIIDEDILNEVLTDSLRRFDKGGDLFYEQISALHKSVRGSSPDAALYWLARMLDGGCDPIYLARRIVRMASEDIGNADPRALQLALNAWDTQERLGSPEGELALAQAVVFLACAAKSNAVYIAFNQAMQDAKQSGSVDVPTHLRNAPTKFMKNLGYGREYRYAHDEKDGFVAGEKYFPDEIGEKKYYHPVSRGLEIKIAEKLAKLRQLNKEKM